jgi:flagellar biosynthetic protein FliR
LNDSLQRFLMQAFPVGLRVAGVMTFAPFLGSTAIPARIKALLTLAITALLFPVVTARSVAIQPSNLVQIGATEAFLGLALGLMIQFVFEALQIAGQILGFQLGYSLANIIDPLSQVDTPVLAVFHQTVALLIFLQLNVHHWILRALTNSFELLPVGTAHLTGPLFEQFMKGAASMWLIGVQIAAPVLLATMMTDVALSFLGKISPQLPVLLIGISVKSLIGFSILIGVIALWPAILQTHFANAIASSERFLHLAAQR